ASTLPMLVKAYRSRDLASYSLGNIALANLGNAVHAVYVYSLPPGPIWLLHTFYLASSALMLGWYLRYGLRKPAHSAAARMGGSPGADRAGAADVKPGDEAFGHVLLAARPRPAPSPGARCVPPASRTGRRAAVDARRRRRRRRVLQAGRDRELPAPGRRPPRGPPPPPRPPRPP